MGRWLDGENPTIDRITDPGLLATELAAFAATLHRIDPTDGPPAGRGVPLAMPDAPMRTAIADLNGV
ncbi:MAG: hypothetical protein ACT4P5_01470 [Armatimonadota bacterium]